MEPKFSFNVPSWRDRFPDELTRALKRRRMSRTRLAAHVGASPRSVNDWLAGRRFPLVIQAERLAEALEAPQLATMILEAHRVACQICGKVTIKTNRGGNAQLYCSAECKLAANNRRKRNVTILDSHLTRHRLTKHQDAVDAMCRECTLGESLCHQWQCPLRCVSPIPLSIAARREQLAAEATA